jgi:DNA-binding transcriptional MocR family regulator
MKIAWPFSQRIAGNAVRAGDCASLSRWQRVLPAQSIAAKLNVAPENVILGNGSNEVIEFLGHAFLNPGDELLPASTRSSFINYSATAFGVRTIETPTPDYQQNLDATLERDYRKNPNHFHSKPKQSHRHTDLAARDRQFHVASAGQSHCRF